MTDATKDTVLRGSLVMAGNALRSIVGNVLFRAGDKEASDWLAVHPSETQGLFEAAVLAIREKKGIKPEPTADPEKLADAILAANATTRPYGRLETNRPTSLAQMAGNLHVWLDRLEVNVDQKDRWGLPHHVIKPIVKALQKIGTVRAKGVQTPNMDAVYRTTTDIRDAIVVTLEAALTVNRFGLKAADVNNADEAWAARAEATRRAEATAAQIAAVASLRAIQPTRIEPLDIPLATVPVSDVKAAAGLARRLWSTETDDEYNVHSIVALPVLIGAVGETWVFAFGHGTPEGLPPVRLAGLVAAAGYTGARPRDRMADVLSGETNVEPTAIDAARAELQRLAMTWSRAVVQVWDCRAPAGAKGRATLPARVMVGASSDGARYGLTGVGLTHRSPKDGLPWFVTTNGHILMCARTTVSGSSHVLMSNAMLPGNVARVCGPTLAVAGGNGSVIAATETTLYVGPVAEAPDYWHVIPSAENNNHALVEFEHRLKALTAMPAHMTKNGRRAPLVLTIPSLARITDDMDVDQRSRVRAQRYEENQTPVLDVRGLDDLPNVNATGLRVHDVGGGKKRSSAYEPPERVGFNPDYIAEVSKFLLNMGAVSCTWQIGNAYGPVVVRGYDIAGDEVPALAILMPMRLD